MSVLVTGSAGFIGMHTANALLEKNEDVIGIDNINDYYDPELKRARLEELQVNKNFYFEKLDFAVPGSLNLLIQKYPEIDRIIHLGAQAGVRYSIDNPHQYMQSNLCGQLAILEFCKSKMRDSRPIKNFVYASSSSVYGSNKQIPFSINDNTDQPVSFYGATKKAGEVMAHSYAHLYQIPTIGLRFFTVYGPWGRPDMSPYIFTNCILNEKPIKVFNKGEMMRDFTFIDDIVSGILGALDTPPINLSASPPHKIYNLGNNKPVSLMNYINVIERACNKKAIIDLQPMQAGDVVQTYANIEESERDLGYAPTTSIDIGIPRFVDWFISYHS
ncbi:MAG: NAD-dependent epimerase/dehydratase family protein [Thalassobaculaceae bacterium]